MKVTQVATILNEISKEMVGETAVVNEDLSNIVDIGRAFTNVLTADGGVDNYVKKIMDKARIFRRLYLIVILCYEYIWHYPFLIFVYMPNMPFMTHWALIYYISLHFQPWILQLLYP